MKTFLTILFLLVCSLNFESCKKDNLCALPDVKTPFEVPCKLSKNIDTVKMYIEGIWTWLQEERVVRGQPTKYLTPNTEEIGRAHV